MDETGRGGELPGEENGYEPDLITLEDENGREHTFEVLDVAEEGGQKYFAVAPYHEDPAKRLEEDAEMLIMRVGEDGGDEYLDIVEDDAELRHMGEVFTARLAEVYNIDLDELQSGAGG